MSSMLLKLDIRQITCHYLVIANAAFSTLYYEGNFKPILTSIFDLFVLILQDQWDLGWNVEILLSFQGFPSLILGS